jgi:hypothetical protein
MLSISSSLVAVVVVPLYRDGVVAVVVLVVCLPISAAHFCRYQLGVMPLWLALVVLLVYLFRKEVLVDHLKSARLFQLLVAAVAVVAAVRKAIGMVGLAGLGVVV